jgi:hypothetical protein
MGRAFRIAMRLADSLMLVWQHPVDFKTGRQADYPSILGGVE